MSPTTHFFLSRAHRWPTQNFLVHHCSRDQFSKRCDDLARAVDRLSDINAQDALILLRASFSVPMVQHLMRCLPSAGNVGLQTFDNLLRTAVGLITNSNMSDMQWLQASLPIRHGGLDVRRVTSLAIPAFMASAVSTVSFEDHC